MNHLSITVVIPPPVSWYLGLIAFALIAMAVCSVAQTIVVANTVIKLQETK